MASAYPNGFDDLKNPANSDLQNNPAVAHANNHAAVNDAVEAIQSELGLAPSAEHATVRARLDALKAEMQALTADINSLENGLAALPIYAVDNVSLQTIGGVTSIKDGGVAPASISALLANNTVRNFANITARNAAIPSPAEGTLVWMEDADRLLMHDGTGWVILAEPIQTNTTASFTGFTGGSPTYANRYRRRDGMCWFYNKMTFGGTPSSITGGSFSTTLPFTASTTPNNLLRCHFIDQGSQHYPGWAASGTTSIIISALTVSGSVIPNYPTLTVPFTWAATDTVEVSGEYEMATRHSTGV